MADGLQLSDGDPRVMSDVFNSECVGRDIIEHITGRWSPLILAALRGGPMRFHELRDRIDGISEKMLSQKLRMLVRDGLVERSVEPSTPPKVSYELTALGSGLSRPFQQLIRWIGANAVQVVAAQQRFDGEATSHPGGVP